MNKKSYVTVFYSCGFQLICRVKQNVCEKLTHKKPNKTHLYLYCNVLKLKLAVYSPLA